MKNIVMAALLATAALAASIGSADALQLWPPATARTEKQAPANTGREVQLAQATDASSRLMQLEEQIRQLNGRVEEMSFQLLQMQEQMRKTQQDNEFRFQDLEKSKTGSGKKSQLETPVETPAAPTAPRDSVAQIITQSPATATGLPPAAPTAPGVGATPNAAPNGLPNAGTQPRNLGAIELDSKGMQKTATLNETPPAANTGLPGVDSGRTAAVPQIASLNSEKDVYQSAYGHVLSGDYTIAEAEFRDFIQRYPKSDKIADASFWLGEAEYSQGKYNEAAKTFLNAHQTYGTSPKAPEMLLKLGMSLAGLDNTETACATLREVVKRYPKASKPVLTKVASEQKRLAC